ncbi:MAG TPA: hypothetical protein VI603_03650, partial [Saprospiraceae bacterium]|nr:hypothetical protein [Saprospiraceae bacterium]
DCTTGISGPGETKSLEIRYSSLGAYFIVPADVKEFSMWTYDGRMITADHDLTAGEKIFVSKYIPVPGLYFIQARSDERVYVGKVVGF